MMCRELSYLLPFAIPDYPPSHFIILTLETQLLINKDNWDVEELAIHA